MKFFGLLSGQTSTGGLEKIDRDIIEKSYRKNILVLDFGKNQLEERQNFFIQYFNKIGANRIDFLSKKNKVFGNKKSFDIADMLYLPGCDTEILIENIVKENLVSKILNFPGIIFGNSAGAYALCPDYIKIGENKVDIIPSLNIVPFWVKVHYESKFDSILLDLSKKKKIYGLSNNSAILWDGNKMDFIGEVYSFKNGNKRRVGNER